MVEREAGQSWVATGRLRKREPPSEGWRSKGRGGAPLFLFSGFGPEKGEWEKLESVGERMGEKWGRIGVVGGAGLGKKKK